MSASPIIHCRDAIANIDGFHYEGAPLNFEAYPGEIINIIGPDYSGKSAWVKMLSGKEPPHSGEVSIFGRNVFDNERANWIYLRRNMAFIETDTALLSAANLLQNVMIPALYHVTETPDRVYERAHYLLEEIAPDTFPGALPALIRKDQRYRVAIARALIVRPRAIILDSPFDLLDAASATALKTFLLEYSEENNVLIVIVSHDIQFALQHSDKILFVSQNHIEQFEDADELRSSEHEGINEFLELHLTT